MGCVRLVVTPDDVDDASGRLWLHDPLAVSEAPADGGLVVLLAGYPDAATAAMVADDLPPRWRPEVVPEPDESTWRDAWRVGAEPVVEAGVRIWPGWWDPPGDDFEGLTVVIDPGPTFGSGSHPTTRLCVRALTRVVDPSCTVLDVGCGSGVLSVVAARLGARHVVALDVDPDAVAATRANAEANGVADHVHADLGTADGALADRFAVVVANIGAAVLTELTPRLVAVVAPQGTIVVSGLLDEQVPAVVAGLRQGGLALATVEHADGWAAATLEPKRETDT